MESRKLLSILALSLVVVNLNFVCAKTTTKQDPIKNVNNLIAQNKLPQALDILNKLAQKDNYQAQLELAQIYDFGKGVPPNKELALNWYNKAALNYKDRSCEPGSSSLDQTSSATITDNDLEKTALNIDGFKNYYGLDTEQNKDKAFDLFTKAASLGSRKALNNIAVMYLKGDLGQDKIALGLEKLNEAIELDSLDALTNLAYLYQVGDKVEKNPKLALQYYERAAAFGVKAAQYDLGYMYQRGISLKQDYQKCAVLYSLAKLNSDFTPSLYLGNFSEIELKSFKAKLSKINNKKQLKSAKSRNSLIGSLKQLKSEI